MLAAEGVAGGTPPPAETPDGGVDVVPVGPDAPAGDAGPVVPVGEVGPVVPVGEVGPVVPVGEVGPVVPVGEVGPVVPVGPLVVVVVTGASAAATQLTFDRTIVPTGTVVVRPRTVVVSVTLTVNAVAAAVVAVVCVELLAVALTVAEVSPRMFGSAEAATEADALTDGELAATVTAEPNRLSPARLVVAVG